jgi:hypothetical protein
VQQVGLDAAEAVRFLDSDDLVAHVWHSYGWVLGYARHVMAVTRTLHDRFLSRDMTVASP